MELASMGLPGGPRGAILIQPVPLWPLDAAVGAGVASPSDGESSGSMILHRDLPAAQRVCTGQLATWAPC